MYVNPRAGHRYAREVPGHESLNFKFDKSIDKNGKIHGYIQWTNPPKKFLSDGLIIFYSRNLNTNKGEIVGIYGKAEILRTPIKVPYIGFEKNYLLANIVADEKYSMRFPIELNEKKYKNMLNTNRLVPQVGFRLVNDLNIPKSIIQDEIVALRRSGIRQEELEKLVTIYEYIVEEPYRFASQLYDDLREQEEILDILNKKKENLRESIIQDLKNLKPTASEIVNFEGKTYKRDNKTIANLKYLRNSKCQICSHQILKKDGRFYVEAAHIVPKHKKGLETPDNILILCPNHHKEFDFGNKEGKRGHTYLI